MYTATPQDSYLDAAISAALQVRVGGGTRQAGLLAGLHAARAAGMPAKAHGGAPGCRGCAWGTQTLEVGCLGVRLAAGPLPSQSAAPNPPLSNPLWEQVHCDERPGDILVFLTGQDEIESCARLITERAAALPPPETRDGAAAADGEEGGEEGEEGPGRPRELLVLPIYAALPPEQQLKVFQPAPPGTRKVRAGPAGLPT